METNDPTSLRETARFQRGLFKLEQLLGHYRSLVQLNDEDSEYLVTAEQIATQLGEVLDSFRMQSYPFTEDKQRLLLPIMEEADAQFIRHIFVPFTKALSKLPVHKDLLDSFDQLYVEDSISRIAVFAKDTFGRELSPRMATLAYAELLGFPVAA